MQIKILMRALAAAAIFSIAGSASAAQVVCGNSNLGVRVTSVDPALVGGLCYAQNGNLDNDFLTVAGSKFLDTDPTAAEFLLKLLGKEVVSVGDTASPLIGYTIGGKEFGGWTVAESAWTSWSRVFIGFHFGGAGTSSANNPDSFVIELKPTDNVGTWSLTGTAASTITGLSNVYLFGRDPCTGEGCIRIPQEDVPEPASQPVVGLGLIAAAAVRRRRRA